MFSVVIPLYNKGIYVSRAIQSVLIQTEAVWELIVVDDGSTDEGPSVVQGFSDARIRLIRQTNGGASSARNRGVQEARYAYVAFLDADDWWHPGYLEKQAEMIRRFPGAGIYATAHQKVYGDEKVRLPSYTGFPPSPWEGVIDDYFLAAVEGGQPVWTGTAVLPKAALLEVGGFPLDRPTGQDKACWSLVALKYPVVFSHFVGASYVQDTLFNRNARRLKALRPLVTEEALRKGLVPPEKRRSVQLFNQRIRVYHATREVQRGHRGRALKLVWLAGLPANQEILVQQGRLMVRWFGVDRVLAGIRKIARLLRKQEGGRK